MYLVPHEKSKLFEYNRARGVYNFGHNNSLGDEVEYYTDNSSSAYQCTDLYERFLFGSGTYGQELLFSEICHSVARYQGAFIHISYNANLEKTFKVLPYNLVRVGKKDNKDFVSKYFYSKNGWGNGYKKTDVILFDEYSEDENITRIQIKKQGLENWNGQIYHFKISNEVYPTPLLARVLNYAKVEYQLSKFYLSTTERGFEDVKVVEINSSVLDTENVSIEDMSGMLKGISGIEKSGSTLVLAKNGTDRLFDLQTLPNTSNPEKYQHFEETAQNKIRKVFKNIPPQLIDYISGKLGSSSGKDFLLAESIYNANTERDRQKIMLLFEEVIGYKLKITPLKLIDSGTIEE